MHSSHLLWAVVTSLSAFAQTTPFIAGLGYSQPIPLTVAPGQLVTLFVAGASSKLTTPLRAPGNPLPTTLGGISVTYHQGSDRAAAILEVRPISTCSGIPVGSSCGTILAVTAQLPFDMLTVCPVCGRIDIPASLTVTVDGIVGSSIAVQPYLSQVHILTTCDLMAPRSQTRLYPTPLPCAPIVTHPDGSPVSANKPAQSGEELVAYAVGLGQTNPPLSVGESTGTAAPTVAAFGIDFNYHPNALATQPVGPNFFGTGEDFPRPTFTGATPGFVGLYQVNFIVPPSPPNLAACVDSTGIVPFSNVVQSNLTVSIGSAFSFDGAGICVQPGS